MQRLGRRKKHDTGVHAMRCECKDCDKRTVGCHGKCEKYAAYREQMDRIKKLQAVESSADEVTSRAIRRTMGKYKWNTKR